jgi:hypothetical protein
MGWTCDAMTPGQLARRGVTAADSVLGHVHSPTSGLRGAGRGTRTSKLCRRSAYPHPRAALTLDSALWGVLRTRRVETCGWGRGVAHRSGGRRCAGVRRAAPAAAPGERVLLLDRGWGAPLPDRLDRQLRDHLHTRRLQSQVEWRAFGRSGLFAAPAGWPSRVVGLWTLRPDVAPNASQRL